MLHFLTYMPLVAFCTAGILVTLYLIGIGKSSFQVSPRPHRSLTDLVNCRQGNMK